MATSFRDKVIDELLDNVVDNEAFSDNERSYAKALANNIANKGDEEVKKILYASFNDPKLYNITKAIASAMPKDTEIEKVTRATAQAPKYRTEIGKMFEKFGGDEVVDERSPKYWARPSSGIDRKVISEIAESNGMSADELQAMLNEESRKETNRQIFSGTATGDNFVDFAVAQGLKFFAPRTMKGLEEGKGFVPAEVAKDVAENIIYDLNPVARVAQLGVRALGKFAPRVATESATKLGQFGTRAVGSFGTPAVVELSDKLVDEATDSERVRTSGEIIANIFGSGVSNLAMKRLGKRMMTKYGVDGGTRKAIKESVEGVAEETPKMKTAKEFIDETEKALKEREKVAKKVQEKGRGIKPSEQAILDSVKGISLGNKDMDKQITEIAKLMAKQDLSLEEATAKHFEKVRKNMKNDGKFFKYLDDFKAEIPSESEPIKKMRMVDGKYVTTIEEQPKKYKYFFSVDENGIVKPSNEVAEAIKDSSWGKVLTTKFEKPKRTTPSRESFITKRSRALAKLGIQAYPSASYRISSKIGEPTGSAVLKQFGYDAEKEKQKREKEMEKRLESEARSKYVFNPYVSKEDEKQKKPSGIRAYLRGESDEPIMGLIAKKMPVLPLPERKPSDEEIEQLILEEYGIK